METRSSRFYCFRMRMAAGRGLIKGDFSPNTIRHFDAPASTPPLRLQIDFSRLFISAVV